MNPGNFFSELKRRNVYKVAIAYAVVAWLLIQAASIFFPAFDAPSWVMKIFIIVIIFGFPVALIFSWAFEITPEGIKLESEIEPTKSIARRTGRKIVAVTIALAVVAAGLFVYQVVRSRSTSTPQNTASAARTEAATAAPNKSIAVLPFDNLSRDPDNAYFCEGVQDEILTRLAKVADLKVISRTSTQHFKSTPDNLPQIAKQLGVAHILEGSVQKASDQVRVNVQLINALTDAHLWADTYDRKLTDIFAVESEIAKTIADTLQARLTGSEKNEMSKKPTEDPEAYEFYLKGRFFWNKRTGVDLRKAIEYFNQAVARDPNYALAYVGLSDSYLLLPNYGSTSSQEALPPARTAAKKALALDDSLAEAHASLGLLATIELDLERALSELERAVQLKPNYATAHHWLALANMTLARFDPAIAEGKRAIELDPLSVIINADCSWLYLCARRYDQAEAQARKTLEIDPHFFLAHYYLGIALQLKGRLSEAIPEFQKSFDLNGDPYSLGILGQAYARNGQNEEALKILARLNEQRNTRRVAPYAMALVYSGLGDKERAIDELDRGYRDGETNYLFVIKVDPLLDDLRGNPRFEALVQKVVAPKMQQ
jgi:TolB-like protein/Flp pilus assembly protein TadD